MIFLLFYTFTMLVKSAGKGEHCFIILIPSRDTEKLLNEYRAALFAKGFYGAYSFPLAAPLAELSRPFNRDELKKLAGNIRSLSLEKDGKISGSETCTNTGFGELSFFGIRLDFSAGENLFPETAKGKIVRTFFPPVLCAALVRSITEQAGINENPPPKEGPTLSFRAAALANLAIRSLPKGKAQTYSFEWKISPPVWLPAYKKNRTEK